MKYKITNSTVYHNVHQYNGRNMVSGVCPFCDESSGFKINGSRSSETVPLKCDNCEKNVVWDYEKKTTSSSR